MDRILSLIPEASWHLFERYLLETVAEIRSRREARHMTEVCVRNQTRQMTLKTAAKRAADLPDAEAIAAICASWPAATEAQAAAHLAFARKKLKAERRQKRDHTIATLARQGYGNAEIAHKVGVSETTAARKAAEAIRGKLP